MNETRKKLLKKCSRVVVKVGTRLLTDESRIPHLVEQIDKLRRQGLKVILVSSGAVGIGMRLLKLKRRPAKLSDVQALAALGQNKLMSLYENACREKGFHSAQMLLTAEDLRDRERHLNVLNCINSLWSRKILPIVNENDCVSVDELKFGDNDILAALLGTMTRAELTIILTNVDGLHSMKNGVLEKRIPEVKNINGEMFENAAGTDDSAFSIGGMTSKLRAAQTLGAAGEYLWIADGRDPEIIDKIIAGKDVGTLFLPGKSKQMQSKKRWIKYFSKHSGCVIIDDGAAQAVQRKGKSLLPSGVKAVEGDFKRGDTVEVRMENGKIIAWGLVNYSSSDAAEIAGKRSSEIRKIIRHASDDELIHRNNMVLEHN